MSPKTQIQLKYLALLIKWLFSLTFSPQISKKSGATVNANAANPNNVLAHWYSKALYIRLVANGNQAAIKFSPKPKPLSALPAKRL